MSRFSPDLLGRIRDGVPLSNLIGWSHWGNETDKFSEAAR